MLPRAPCPTSSRTRSTVMCFLIARPRHRGTHRTMPAAHQSLGRCAIHRGSNDVNRRVEMNSSAVLHTSRRRVPPVRPRRAPSSRPCRAARPGTPSRSAWNCMSQSFARAAVDAQRSRRAASPARHRVDDFARFRRPSLRARRARDARASCRASGRRWCRAQRLPVRRAEAHERRHEIHAVVRRRATAPALRFRRRVSMMPSPSRSHCTAAPAMKIDASSAYAGPPRRSHATVVSNPPRACGAVGPVLNSRTRRCRTCSCPRRRASIPGRTAPPAGRPRRRESGFGARTHSRVVDAKVAGRGPHFGQHRVAARRTGRTARRSTRVDRCRTASCATHCVGSVACTAPPVSRQMSHVSIVPTRELARGARVERPLRREQPLEFGRREVRIEHQTGARERSASAARRELARSGPPCADPARRSRGATGLPVVAIPDDDRLALVRDADGSRRRAGRCDRLARRAAHSRSRISSRRARPSPAAG